ncbi:hypothetical protein MJO28_015140 [Puccinia striiformis f. sp. tritici]|uniref:Uncharacterized protein n=1 Tax=Puccinia striiformis f. sp. tritici TaxID=168172 RepID=A0ACC0DTQ2_9BASI|nr:hypothetical protein MJO28_015140 [Puccinia striiformis f. sp. tritici]
MDTDVRHLDSELLQLLGHPQRRENVDDITAKHGFLPGFRYNIQVRQNVFAFRKTRMSDGKELMTDISVFRKPIFDEAWTLTQKLDKLVSRTTPTF